MKLIKLIYILLIGLISLAPPSMEAAKRKKRAKVTNTTTKRAKKGKAKSQKVKQNKTRGSKTKYRNSRNKVTRSIRSQRRSRAERQVEREERRAELRRLDSLRLRNGGTEPLPAPSIDSLAPIANAEPMHLRFRRADSTLSSYNIERLYFDKPSATHDSIFWRNIIPEVDQLIGKEQYKKALALAQKGLFYRPLHLGLLKRACELAQHEKDPELNNYIWQLSEILSMIQGTGDGKSPKTALRIVDANDALTYETLWLDHEISQIQKQRTSKYEGREILVLSIQGAKGKPIERYYQIGS